MIQIDRSSDIPIHVQLVTRLRYLIASGQFKKGDPLPPTRTLAKRLDVSFHTVRRAYNVLVEEQIVESRQGSGYHVVHFAPRTKSSRMEQGATIVHEALQHLIGIGLDENEIDYLIQEQSAILETEETPYKIVLLGPFREWAEQCASALSRALDRDVSGAVIAGSAEHKDADFLVVPYRSVRDVLAGAPNADVIGITVDPGMEALSAVSRLLDRETLGIIARYADAVGPLTRMIRDQTGFGGQILAAAVEHGDTHIAPLIGECDLLLHTEAAHALIRDSLTDSSRNALLAFEISPLSIEHIRKEIPR